MSDSDIKMAGPPLPGLGGGLRQVVENSDAMAAIGNILASLEGMQEQVQALTDLVITLDKRVDDLEKKAKPKLISSR